MSVVCLLQTCIHATADLQHIHAGCLLSQLSMHVGSMRQVFFYSAHICKFIASTNKIVASLLNLESSCILVWDVYWGKFKNYIMAIWLCFIICLSLPFTFSGSFLVETWRSVNITSVVLQHGYCEMKNEFDVEHWQMQSLEQSAI